MHIFSNFLLFSHIFANFAIENYQITQNSHSPVPMASEVIMHKPLLLYAPLPILGHQEPVQ
jgi:hypothetical protein